MKNISTLSVLAGFVLVMLLGNGCVTEHVTSNRDWAKKDGTRGSTDKEVFVSDDVGPLVHHLFGSLFGALFFIDDSGSYPCYAGQNYQVQPVQQVQPVIIQTVIPVQPIQPVQTPQAPACAPCAPQAPAQCPDSNEVIPGEPPPQVPTSYAAPAPQTTYAYVYPAAAPQMTWYYVSPCTWYNGAYYPQGGWLNVNVNLGGYGGGEYGSSSYYGGNQRYGSSYYQPRPVAMGGGGRGYYGGSFGGTRGGWGGGSGSYANARSSSGYRR